MHFKFRHKNKILLQFKFLFKVKFSKNYHFVLVTNAPPFICEFLSSIGPPVESGL